MNKGKWVFLFIVFVCYLSNSSIAQKHIDSIPGTSVSFEVVMIPYGVHTFNNIEIQIDSFWMATHEVTFDEYIHFQDLQYDTDASNADIIFDADAITRPSPPYEDFSKGMGRKGGFPAVSMTQQAALQYCYWLYKKTGVFYRLPTEAEWEYACLLGQTDAEDSDELEEIAWFFENSFEKFQKTGEKKSNALGIFDMLGNIAEWTSDYYLSDEKYTQYLKDSTSINPWVIPTRRHPRTVKGGSYDDNPEDCTCKSRLKSRARWQARDPQIPKSKWWNPDSPFVGFRIIRPIQQPSDKLITDYFKIAIKY